MAYEVHAVGMFVGLDAQKGKEIFSPCLTRMRLENIPTLYMQWEYLSNLSHLAGFDSPSGTSGRRLWERGVPPAVIWPVLPSGSTISIRQLGCRVLDQPRLMHSPPAAVGEAVGFLSGVKQTIVNS
ncbi:hypothetical protein HL42_1304 [Trichophyton rubrum]|nr:hypothetical protein HL42_1304 [Trichophyton rubrum]